MQDVKDEGTATGATKEEVIETNERLRAIRVRMDESYETAKKALVGLMGKYNDSKNVHNIFQRYNMLKAMIKVSFLNVHIFLFLTGQKYKYLIIKKKLAGYRSISGCFI